VIERVYGILLRIQELFRGCATHTTSWQSKV